MSKGMDKKKETKKKPAKSLEEKRAAKREKKENRKFMAPWPSHFDFPASARPIHFEDPLATPNYKHQKKQREAQQKRKKDEKEQRKAEKKGPLLPPGNVG
jgi:hypothetical protein